MSERSIDPSFYELLEVSPEASEHEIHKAYLRAKQTYSPDSPALYTMFSEDEARDLLKLIEEAYAILGSVARREEYDKKMNLTARAEKIADQRSSRSAFMEVLDGGPSSVKKGDALVSTPDGHGRTRIGVFKIDRKMEEEILTRTEFDGHFLQKVRLYKQVTLDQLSTESRISKPYLIAVEANDFVSLPAAVFVRGFVSQVARILGLPDQKVANSYMEFYKKSRGS